MIGAGLAALGVAADAAPPELVLTAWRAPGADARADVGLLRCWPAGFAASNASVRVEASDGRPLGREVVWWGEGDPLDLRFECPAGTTQVVVRIGGPAGQGGDSAAAWQARGGVLLETRWWNSDGAENWTNAWSQWQRATRIAGRSVVGQIFDGLHRHGPAANFIARYDGWFRVERPGRHAFATISDDASFLRIDGKIVAEWPGWHNTDGGRHGQHHGWIQLDAGDHRIDYLNVQKDSGFQVAAAWRRPGTETFEVMPPEAFRPAARFEVASVSGGDPAVGAAAFRWEVIRHAVAAAGAIVEMRFEAANPGGSRRGYRWTFADGLRREGSRVEHVFCAAGVTSVSLEVFEGQRKVGAQTRAVRVGPDWTRRVEYDAGDCRELVDGVTDDLFDRMAGAALSAWVAWAVGEDDTRLLDRLAAVCVRRAAVLGTGGSGALYQVGFHLQRPSLRRYEDAKSVWRALLATKGVAPDLAGRTALHLGGLLLHGEGNVADSDILFQRADEQLPAGDDRRLLDIYRGDLHVFAGRPEEARACYLRAGTVVSPDNLHYEVRRAERLERARRLLAAGEADAAERVLRELEWERPMERMGLATGLLLTRVQRARGESDFARQAVRRLRSVAAGDPLHAELLALTAELLREAGRDGEADRAVAELRTLFPYSAEAARARPATPPN